MECMQIVIEVLWKLVHCAIISILDMVYVFYQNNKNIYKLTVLWWFLPFFSFWKTYFSVFFLTNHLRNYNLLHILHVIQSCHVTIYTKKNCKNCVKYHNLFVLSWCFLYQILYQTGKGLKNNDHLPKRFEYQWHKKK